MKALHGLVIGKFYPPHAGHKLLIRTAAHQCARVSVIVMAASHESLPLQDRVEWMREIHRDDPGVVVTGIIDDVPVDYGDDAIWEQHVALMRQALDSIAAVPVDAVFSSEPYGDELARRLGARAVTLDVKRELAPVSATRVRADPPAMWEFLEPVVRGALALKVVLVGAESTGKTTLSRALADQLRARGGADGLTRWVPEYGRDYSVQKYADAIGQAALAGLPRPGFESVVWESGEFLHIARTQRRMEEAEARLGGPVLVCDTDVFATAIWHERYMGSSCAEVEALAEKGRGDLYLLTHHDDVPFAQDGIRDGESIRAWMTGRFAEALDRTRRRCVIVRGTYEECLMQGLRAIDELRAGASEC
jgi:HTH-type transcriptional regulator, transcriptional repressor of NAD biosynthesis genes